MQRPVDPKLKARVLKWRLRVLPEDPAEARFWVTETSTPFVRPDLDMTTTAEAEHGAARGQGGPLNESTAGNMTSPSTRLSVLEAGNVKQEVTTPHREADLSGSAGETQSGKRKREE